MDPFLARTMVENLSKGIDPLSGRALPYSDSCSNEEIQDALLEVLAHCTIESNEMYLLRLRKEKEEERERRREEKREKAQAEQKKKKQLLKSFPREEQKWTAEDEENLLYLHKEGYSFYLISNVLHRSPESIAKHLRKLQCMPLRHSDETELRNKSKVLPRNSGKAWTREDDEVLCRMFDAGVERKKMCDYLQRSEEALAARLVKLGKIRSRKEFRNR